MKSKEEIKKEVDDFYNNMAEGELSQLLIESGFKVVDGTGEIIFTDDEENEEDEFLFDADENCNHEIVSASGGGIKCTKCKGWFCY